jgi:hypothetical protein
VVAASWQLVAPDASAMTAHASCRHEVDFGAELSLPIVTVDDDATGAGALTGDVTHVIVERWMSPGKPVFDPAARGAPGHAWRPSRLTSSTFSAMPQP